MLRRTFLTTTLTATTSSFLKADTANTDSNSLYTVAVIGHTNRGNFGHGIDTLWLSCPRTKIIAVSDPDPNTRNTAREKLKAAHAFESYQQMLSTIKADIIAIGPRHIDQHHDMVIAAANSGAKGIYIEKPYCRDLVEADSIGDALKKNGTKLAIAHRNRYHPVLPLLKELIQKGEIGQLLEIRTRGKEDRRGGPLDLWVLGSHVLNLATYFTGAPTACSASILQDGRPITKADLSEGQEGVGLVGGNQIHARFDTASNVPIFYDCIRDAGVKEANFGVQLIGNKGIIDLRVDTEPLAHLIPGNPFQPTQTPRPWLPVTTGGIGKPEPISNINAINAGHQGAALDLIAAIEEDREPLCNHQEGRLTVEMILAVFASHCQGGTRIPLPLQEKRNALTLL